MLNSTIAKAVEAQQGDGLEVRHALFDITRHGRRDVSKLPYSERYALLKQLEPGLPKSMEVVEAATEPEEQRQLWEQIKSGEHPLTTEGIVAHPAAGGVPIKVPIKVPIAHESDVIIKSVYPEVGARENRAGGFQYALADDPDTVVGSVGGGFSDADKRDMLENPDAWVGRTARIVSKGQFNSGAFRAPTFVTRHEG